MSITEGIMSQKDFLATQGSQPVGNDNHNSSKQSLQAFDVSHKTGMILKWVYHFL